MSIFHPDYPSSIAFNYLYLFVGVWEGQYEALDYAEREVEKLREDAINNLLNTTSSADFAITNLISELKIQNSSQKNWLYGHSDEANKIINFLNANRINGNVNVEAVSFSILAVEALMNKQFSNFDEILYNKTTLDSSETGDLDNNTIGGEDLTNYDDFNPIQQTWPTINPVISINDFVGWNRLLHPTWECMEYSKAQIAKKGYKISNYFNNTGQTIQIYTEQNGVNQTELQKGLSYLKYALEKGIPVIVGIDNHAGSPNPNTDNTTDHFVVIVGMGSDANGKYFIFYDNASGASSQGANTNNKLYYNSTTGKITGASQTKYAQYIGYYDYIVTMIRKSKSN